MYKYSKAVMKKIADANILDKNELATTEIALRMYDIHCGIMNECIGVVYEDECKYELEHPAIPAMKKKD